MNLFKKIIFLIFLTILLIYVSSITNIPDSILLFKGETLNLKTALGISITEKEKQEVIQTSVNINDNVVEKEILRVSFLKLFDIKEIEVSKMPVANVIPLGNTIGLKLYTNGVLVIGMAEIEGKKPYQDSEIKEGDLIIEVNSKPIETTTDLINRVNESNGEKIELKYLRNGSKYTTNIEPVATKKNEYKIGLWVRDGAIGVGTITYYNPTTKTFAALGHPIIDLDTEEIISIKNGELVRCKDYINKKGRRRNTAEK